MVVPCYNYGRFLGDCVASIVTQPGVTVDVLVIDDASPDGSGGVAQSLAKQYPQVRLIRHARNQGHIATYNEGLSLVTGDYVVLLSADDMLTPGALSRATALLEAHPSVGMVYGNPLTFLDTLPPPRTRASSWSVWPGSRWIRAQCRRGLSIVYSPEAVVRRSVHQAAGYYRPELPHSGDLELWLRIAAVSDIGRVNGADQAFRRVHPASMMQSSYATALLDLKARLAAYDSFLSRAGRGLPNSSSLKELAHRRVAEEALEFACSLLSQSGQQSDFAQEVVECVELAKLVHPGYQQLAAWREYERVTGTADRNRIRSRLFERVYPLRRNLQARWRWQRWHRMGL